MDLDPALLEPRDRYKLLIGCIVPRPPTMRLLALPTWTALLLASACSYETSAPPAVPASKPAASSSATPQPMAQPDMNAAIQTLMAKPEQPVERIEIQHILISFQGAPRMQGITRTRDEARVLAEQVYAEIVTGGDFDALVKKHTNDSAPGIYPMTKAGRAGMVKSFGDVGFRLKVGEVGVAPWDASASPFGWHIIKRLK